MIIDAHCDLLYKLWRFNYDVNCSHELQFDLTKWRMSPVRVQAFAIFVPDYVRPEEQFNVALEMITIFYEKIIQPNPDIIHIRSKQDLVNLKPNQLGAILTLEGCHPIGSDLKKLITLIDHGVRIVGLTWNNDNAVADSIESPHNSGVTPFGYEVIELLNEASIWTDVSHLSVQGFFDVMKQADYVMASHSNAFSVCPHRRNLTDKQIKGLIDRNGWIGITFVPSFTKNTNRVEIIDLLLHIDHFIQIGAVECIGFGSDFDGINETIIGLASVADYSHLQRHLIERYPKGIVDKLAYQNFINKFPN